MALADRLNQYLVVSPMKASSHTPIGCVNIEAQPQSPAFAACVNIMPTVHGDYRTKPIVSAAYRYVYVPSESPPAGHVSSTTGDKYIMRHSLDPSNKYQPSAGHKPADAKAHLTYSIQNILRPEFGLNALKTSKLEGPRNGSPISSILYRPYDICPNRTNKTARQLPETTNKIAKETLPYVDPRKPCQLSMPPLGRLCQTVSRIELPTARPPLVDTPFHPVDKNTEKEIMSDTVSSPSSPGSSTSPASSTDTDQSTGWPAWVYCTRYSDRPSSGPRSRRQKSGPKVPAVPSEEKRPRTAFSTSQLMRLKQDFAENRYLTERRRQRLSEELGLNEAQIKIWFQNKRAKIKKASGHKNPLALQLMAQGLYNHTTVGPEDEDLVCITITD